jgi:hypothetical protein
MTLKFSNKSGPTLKRRKVFIDFFIKGQNFLPVLAGFSAKELAALRSASVSVRQ